MNVSPNFVPRFITGMSRAGTTWLCKTLNEHPDVAAFGETRFFARCWVPPQQDGCYDEETLARVVEGMKDRILNVTIGSGRGCLEHFTHKRQKEIFDETFRRLQRPIGPGGLFAELAQAIADSEGRSIPIEKTPQHVNWLDRILTYLPNSRFVVMVRDPYSFMLSYKHQGDRKEAQSKRVFEKRYHPLACAIVWRGYFRAAMAAQKRYPDKVLLVRLEDMQSRREEILERIQEFFALRPVSLADAVSGDNSSFPEGARRELKPDDVFWMNTVAASEVREYRSQKNSAGFHPFRVAASCAKLPGWAIWNALDMQQRVSGGMASYLWRWIRPTGAVDRPHREPLASNISSKN